MLTESNSPEKWLPPEAYALVAGEYQESWRVVESDAKRPPADFLRVQNIAMFTKLFLEQANGDGKLKSRAATLIERDSSGWPAFRSQFIHLAEHEDVDWVVWGLCFSDFRFHLFAIRDVLGAMPFCFSPMLVCALQTEIVQRSSMSRSEFIETQLNNIDWGVVERRLVCLEEPLDLLADCEDCNALETGGV
jgi:hypothetical protein